MNKNFTKADLKVGYVVKLRDGSLGMIMISGVYDNKDPGLIMIKTSGCWADIARDIDDNLCYCYKYNRRDCDIVEVYGYSTYAYCALKVSTDNRELLWKREEAKKMTVAEIEKALGYKVEVVAEEK